ncbi:MAG: EAL domain-containing protein [Alphaproteobacteria bacterium]|nr:EAL domain-containing protein [Alphaproteobacteria bacterium]
MSLKVRLTLSALIGLAATVALLLAVVATNLRSVFQIDAESRLAAVVDTAVRLSGQTGDFLVWDGVTLPPPLTDALLEDVSRLTGATVLLVRGTKIAAASDRSDGGIAMELRYTAELDAISQISQRVSRTKTIGGDVWYSHHAPVMTPDGQPVGTLSAYGPRANFDAWVSAIIRQVLATTLPLAVLLSGLAWFALGRVFHAFDGVAAALTALAKGKLEVAIPHADSSDEVGEVARAACAFQTSARRVQALEAEERRRAEEARHLSLHDSLTGLPNRRHAQMILEQRLASGVPGAVSLLDLDQFKEVNDTLGHHVGDKLLRKVARRLSHRLSEGAVGARLGGDEFAWFHPPDADADAIAAANAALVEGMSRPFPVGPDEIRIGVSIGTVRYPDHGSDPAMLMRNADIAMYRAKAEGRSTFRLFRPDYAAEIEDRRTLVDALSLAIAAGAIEVQYQPKVRLADGSLSGVEALARWRHPERGPISPAVFIPLAERAGLIPALGEAVLRRACRDMLALSAAGGPPVAVAVNLSGLQLKDSSVVERVQAILAETGLPPERLELELTESAAMEDVDGVVTLIRRFADLGISLSIDDFGTGYSSLSQLHRFQVHKMKIDRSFVTPLGADTTAGHDAEAIVRAIVGLGRALGLDIVAEGIEDRHQATRLAALGVNQGQGWLWAKAMPLTDLQTWIATRAAA